MSADAYLVVRCDHRDSADGRCDAEGHWPVRVAHHTELRRLLRLHRGWRRTRTGDDLCPQHAHTTPPSPAQEADPTESR
ncbi:hypothetical protein [Streptomyces albus]|uniref:hypothetical protein n=1 Tax=Streptomyces albus TaxID=1888 RepID=UPI0024E10A84|nr:hypothetical protein [Streptomyces albus]GHJ18854.1 hypothetical protein TPA0909_04680 [Streptomyces albus]